MRLVDRPVLARHLGAEQPVPGLLDLGALQQRKAAPALGEPLRVVEIADVGQGLPIERHRAAGVLDEHGQLPELA